LQFAPRPGASSGSGSGSGLETSGLVLEVTGVMTLDEGLSSRYDFWQKESSERALAALYGAFVQ
jgi:hypothetical protein